MMRENVIENLTARNDKFSCAYAEKIISESRETDEWYEYFDDFASLLGHPKSLVRNRALHILAANARWDEENRFDTILTDYLSHITDEKPITARPAFSRWLRSAWQSPGILEEFCRICVVLICRSTRIVCGH